MKKMQKETSELEKNNDEEKNNEEKNQPHQHNAITRRNKNWLAN